MRNLLLCTVAALMVAGPASAQDASSAPGAVAYTSGSSDDGARAADRTALLDSVRRTIAPILDVPTLANPVGHTAETFLRNRPPPPGMPRSDPMTAMGHIIARPLDLSKAPDAQGRYPGMDEGAPITVQANDATALFVDGSNFEDVSTHYFTLPRMVERSGPATVLPQGLWDLYVFTRSGEAPWLPVSQEERLLGLIAAAENERDANRAVPEVHALFDTWVVARRGALEAMTPAERASQACAGSTAHPLTEMSDCEPDALGYVRINPDFFDRSLPRSAVQLLTLAVPSEDHARQSESAAIVRDAFLRTSLDAIQTALR